jgi:hypothetical protein
MLSGVQLSLKIGPVPLTPPHEVAQSLVHAKVEEGSGDAQGGFELTFELPVRCARCSCCRAAAACR